jgi:membrane protein DedA with SNARE-associated domain
VVWKPLGYILVFFGMVFEGDGVLFTAAFLTAEGFFDKGDMLITVFLSVIFGDMLWYWVGRRYISSFPRITGWVNRFAGPFDRHLTESPTRTLLLTKFAYGAHHAVLIRAGMSKMDFKKFIKSDLISIFVWVAIIGGLGYFSSVSLSYEKKYLRYAEIALLIALVLFFTAEHYIKKFSQKELQ